MPVRTCTNHFRLGNFILFDYAHTETFRSIETCSINFMNRIDSLLNARSECNLTALLFSLQNSRSNGNCH